MTGAHDVVNPGSYDWRVGRWLVACSCGWFATDREHDIYALQAALDAHLGLR